MPARIYDSFAILKLFQKERHYEKVARLLKQDLRSKQIPLLQIINFGEAIYRTKKDFGEEAKIRAIRNVIRLGFRIIPASDNLVYCVFRSIRPPIPEHSGHLFRGLRPGGGRSEATLEYFSLA